MRANGWVIVVALAALVARAEAQPAEAYGKPLPEAKLRDGTVAVRVVAGAPGAPVGGVEVTLMITPPDGTSPASERRARTDTDGRVTFADIVSDAMVQVKVPGEDGEVTSSRFPMASSGGVRVMLSTLPVAGGARPMVPGGPQGGPQGGPMMGGAAAGAPGGAAAPMMSPRNASGKPRGEQGDAPDMLTVRLSYDDFADPTPPKDHPVLLIGYRFDLRVAGTIVKTDASGRAAFDGLDRRGATTYFAMTLLPRGTDTDRLLSSPVLLPGDTGVRLVLSGDKRTATTPAIDDQTNIDPQPPTPVPAGEVRVALAGLVQPGDPVELVDALTGNVLVTTKAEAPLPAPDTLTGTWGTGADDPALAGGALVLSVGRNGAPGDGATVEIRTRAAATAPPAPAGPGRPATPPAEARWSGTAGASGDVTVSGLPVGVDLDVIVTVDGMALPARTVKLPAAGGRREQVTATYKARGQASARFTGVVGGPERAFLVRAFLRGQPCLSAPFQLPASRGVSAQVLVFPRLIFGFSLESWIDDVFLGVRGSFTLRNSSLAPFIPGTLGKPEELVIPLPAGFVGATVRQDFQEQIGVDPTRGFIVREPVPPGGMGFIAAFSLKTDGGALKWDMDLPYGTLESDLAVRRTPDMKLELPPRTHAREVDDSGNKWYAIGPISVQPKQRMVFSLEGLPQPAAWSRWSRNLIGLSVLLVLVGAVAFALWRPVRATAPVRSRYDELVDELAELGDASEPADAARRERLMTELEALHRAGGAPAAAR